MKTAPNHPVTVLSGRTTLCVDMRMETLVLTDKLLAFRLCKSQTVIDRDGVLMHGQSTEIDVSEGVITRRALEQFKAGGDLKSSGLVIFPDDLKEDIRRRGWHVVFGSGLESKHVNDMRYDIFTAIRNGEAGLANLVQPDWGNYVYYDYTGKPLPVGVHMSYISGNIDNGHYDLIKAADHLLSRPDVTVFNARVRPGEQYPAIARRVADVIGEIPAYNASPQRNRHIEFCWSPSVADFDRLTQRLKARRKSMALTTEWYIAIFDLDLLGLRAAGAALFDDYYQQVERSSYSLDDE